MKREQVKFSFEYRLLDHIGLSMYSSIPKAVSEFIANGYDGDADEMHVTYPEHPTQGSTIVIEDNGEGMTTDDIRSKFLRLGFNKRLTRRKRTPKYKRLPIGNKGIGKLAGFGIADMMVIETFQNGIGCRLTLDHSIMEQENKPLEDSAFPLEQFPTKKRNGTIVTLSCLHTYLQFVPEEELREFIGKEFGIDPNFRIFVNNKGVEIKDIRGRRKAIKESIDPIGSLKRFIVSGYYIIANRPGDVKTPGFAVCTRRRMVLAPSLFDINAGGHHYRTANRVIGRINADFLDPESPKSPFDEQIISTSRDRFNVNHPLYIQFKRWAEEKLKEIAREIDKEQYKQRRERAEERLKRLPPNLREETYKSIEKIVPKLEELSDAEANLIIDIVLQAAESAELRAIISKIQEADERDIRRLAQLLQDWGVYELTVIAERIKNRIQVIDKLAKLVVNINTLEYPDIHRTFEKNMWLLNDNYRVYASNKTLKKLVEREVEKTFKRHEIDRPDLIVKNLQREYVIVELKRPSIKITSKDVTQVLRYRTFLKKNAPGSEDENIAVYLIGGNFDEAVRDRTLRRSGYFMMSYSEIVKEARDRYLEILQLIETGALEED